MSRSSDNAFSRQSKKLIIEKTSGSNIIYLGSYLVRVLRRDGNREKEVIWEHNPFCNGRSDSEMIPGHTRQGASGHLETV